MPGASNQRPTQIGMSTGLRAGWFGLTGFTLLGLSLLAAYLGSWRARPAPPPPARQPTLSISSSQPSISFPPSGDGGRLEEGSGSWTGFKILIFVAVAGLLLMLIRYIVRRLRGEPFDAPVGGLVDPMLMAGMPVPPEVPHNAVGRAFDPRAAADAIISCWVWLEEYWSQQGTTRQPADTPTEYLSRVVAQLGAESRRPARTLLELYQRARFDHVALSETAALQARAAVRDLCRVPETGSTGKDSQ